VALAYAPSRSDTLDATILSRRIKMLREGDWTSALVWALDEVLRPTAESVSKWITLTKFPYWMCGAKRCWIRPVYIQTRALSHQRREGIDGPRLSYWICTRSQLGRLRQWTLLLQQCYNNLDLCLYGCHLPVVGFLHRGRAFRNFCGQKSVVSLLNYSISLYFSYTSLSQEIMTPVN
jgi:hypothetical protein